MHLGETLLPWKSKDKKCCLYKTPNVAAPIWILGDVNAKFYALCTTSYRHTYKSQNFFGSRVTSFWTDLSCHFETPMWNFYQRSTSKSGTRKDYLLHYLRSHVKSTFKRLCRQTLLWCIVMSKMPQEPKRLRGPRERDIERSTPTHACHTHCASRQLGTTADWRYDVSRYWLWDACQMARVRWGTHCEGFHSKEGLHYRIERSAWNQLECNQVQKTLWKSFRSCRQTSNNQPWFMTLEIPWEFLCWAILC